MSREILFRGKRIDNGIFVYGSAVLSGSHAHISVFERIDKGNNALHTNSPVRPETLGEYTGLKDRNGNRIFEGDILKAVRSDRERVFHVIYLGTAFYAPEFHWELIDVDFDYQLEVIGNIHDNPELMEGVMKDD